MSRYSSLLFFSFVLLFVGCSPSLAPLYRDYEVSTSPNEHQLDTRISSALDRAGWTVVSSDTPQAISTEERTLSTWGLYRVTASLEVVPLGENHVRVLIHPYRKFFTGSKSKIPYLSRNLKRNLIPDLRQAFTEQGLVAVGTPMERDRQTLTR